MHSLIAGKLLKLILAFSRRKSELQSKINSYSHSIDKSSICRLSHLYSLVLETIGRSIIVCKPFIQWRRQNLFKKLDLRGKKHSCSAALTFQTLVVAVCIILIDIGLQFFNSLVNYNSIIKRGYSVLGYNSVCSWVCIYNLWASLTIFLQNKRWS
jgi:polyferredoxin